MREQAGDERLADLQSLWHAAELCNYLPPVRAACGPPQKQLFSGPGRGCLCFYFEEAKDKYFTALKRTIRKFLKGQSHEKVGEMSVWGISLGPN
jgi:hypothetical protein